MEYRGLIISGFPGIGKSYVGETNKYARDLESTGIHYVWKIKNPFTGEGVFVENPDWVKKYVDIIQKEATTTDHWTKLVLVSSHFEVRKEMYDRGMPFVIVAPMKSCKNEYMQRYIKRESPYDFIKSVYDHWDEWIASIAVSEAPVIWLKEGQYLADII